MVPRSAAFVNGGGEVPAAPSHGLCGSAGGLPSQSPSGDSSPEGRAKSRLPLWGRWTRVSEDGEGKVPAAPSHGLCGNVGRLPSQSPSGDSSPEGRAKSRLPLWGALVPSGHRSALDRAGRRECHAKGMTERAFPAASGAHVRWPLDEHERSELPWARIDSGGTPPSGKNASLFP